MNIHTSTHALIFGQEVSFGTIAGPVDFIDVYVDGNAAPNAIVEWRLYATVGTLVSRVATSTGGGRKASVLKWSGPNGQYSPVSADGSQYELRAYFAQQGPPPTMKASIVGYDQFDTAVASGASSLQTIPAGFGEVSFATSAGYSQFADAAVEQDFSGQVLFTLYALSEVGGVEAPVLAQPIQQEDGTARIFSNAKLPGATSYRLVGQDPTGAGGQAVRASLACYSTVAAPPSPPSPLNAASVIYRPGLPSSGFFVETWTEVQSFVDSYQGCCTVYIDDSSVSPALIPASSGVTECYGRLVLKAYRQDEVDYTNAVIEDGATLKDLYLITGTLFLTADTQSATPAFDFDTANPGPRLYVEDFAFIGTTATASQPAIVVPTGKLYILSFLNQAGVEVNGTSPLVSIAAGGQFEVFMNDAAFYGAGGGSGIPDTWIQGAGQSFIFYDSSTVTNSLGIPSSQAAVQTSVQLDTHLVEMSFTASENDVLLPLALPPIGALYISVEGFGGSGGGGGGQGGALSATGAGAGGSGGCLWSKASFLFDLSSKLDVVIGAAGAAGTAGAAGSGAGGDGGDGSPSQCVDNTSTDILASLAGSSGGQGGPTSGGGANYPGAQFLPAASAGFPARGGAGAIPGATGEAGQLGYVSLEIPSGSGQAQWNGGVGGSPNSGGGGGGGGGAGPLADGAAGGAGSANVGGTGKTPDRNSGAGAGGGAGGATLADAGGAGALGSEGFLRLWFLAPMTRIFLPSNLRGLLAWYRADQGITLVGGNVSVWADSSGSGDANRNATEATNRPAFKASVAGFNGHPTVDFSNGSGAAGSRRLTTGIWSQAPAQPFTVFAVGRQLIPGRAIFDNRAAPQCLIYDASANGGVNLYAGVNGTPVGSPGAANPCTVCGVFDNAGQSTISLSTFAQTNSSGPGTNALTGITIGNQISGNLQGWEIAELMFFDRILRPSEINQLENYASARYGIVIT